MRAGSLIKKGLIVSKVLDYIKYVAKAVVAIAVPVLWESAIEIINGLQGTWADNPLVTTALAAIAVFMVKNGPKPS